MIKNTARIISNNDPIDSVLVNGLIKRETTDETLMKIFNHNDHTAFGNIPILTLEVYRRNLESVLIKKIERIYINSLRTFA